MQWVMSTEARAARVVDGLVGNRFVGITPPPLLPEKLRERPRVDAARVADVHDVAPRLGHGQHGPLVDGERSGSLVARRARSAHEMTIAASMTKPTAWTQELSEVWFWRRGTRPRVLN